MQIQILKFIEDSNTNIHLNLHTYHKKMELYLSGSTVEVSTIQTQFFNSVYLKKKLENWKQKQIFFADTSDVLCFSKEVRFLHRIA